MIKNIKAGILIHHPKELLLSVNGERLDDYEAVFSYMYYDSINAVMGHDQWAVWFKQLEEVGPTFVVDIYTNTSDEYSQIARIILAHLPDDMKFQVMARYWDFNFFVREMAA